MATTGKILSTDLICLVRTELELTVTNLSHEVFLAELSALVFNVASTLWGFQYTETHKQYTETHKQEEEEEAVEEDKDNSISSSNSGS